MACPCILCPVHADHYVQYNGTCNRTEHKPPFPPEPPPCSCIRHTDGSLTHSPGCPKHG